MNDQEPRGRGKDFLIGFLLSVLLAAIAVGLAFSFQSLNPALIVLGGLTVASLIAIGLQRPYIGFGILTVIAAVPLLLVGSCFVMLAGMNI